jgi:hypothetical protein
MLREEKLRKDLEEDYVKEMLTEFVRFKGECEHDKHEDKERFLNTPLVKSVIKAYTDGILALFNSNLKEEREEAYDKGQKDCKKTHTKLPCPFCKAEFEDGRTLNMHINSKHNEPVLC